MLDLVRERVADHGEVGVGLQLSEDELDDLEAVGPLEVATLLDVGVLVDDARLERREVARGPRQEVVGDVLLETVLAGAARGEAVARGAAAGDRPRQRRVVQLELARVGGERDELDVVPDRLAGARADEAVPAGQLDRQEVAHGEVDRCARPGLADGAHDRVVVATLPSTTLS